MHSENISSPLNLPEGLRVSFIAPSEIPRDENGSIIWPTGFTGSIAHTENTAISIVGRTSDFKGLGVDLENKDRAISSRMSETFSQKLPHELKLEAPPALVIFCLKEALFKAASNAQTSIPSFREIEFSEFNLLTHDCLGAKFQIESNLFVLNAVTHGDYLVTTAYLKA